MKNEQLKSAEECADALAMVVLAGGTAFHDCVKAIQRNAIKYGMTLAAETAEKLELTFAAGDSNILAENAGFSQAIITARDNLTL